MNAFFRLPFFRSPDTRSLLVPPPAPAPTDPTARTVPVRTFQIGDRVLSYTLKRSSRRSVGFVVSRDGLTITAPQRLSFRLIEAAIMEKHRWIFAKLDDWSNRAPAVEAPPFEWCDGAVIALHGATLTLRLSSTSQRRVQLTHDADTAVLRVSAPAGTEVSRIAAAVRQWLQREARQRLGERLAFYAPVVGVRFNAFALSSARTRWGSCTSAGNIRLNWRLIHFRPEVLDYVVIHELAHLREMNHSPRFWAVVESVMPDYLQWRALLKQPAVPAIPRF